MQELSMADKVKALGFDVEEFKKDMFEVDDAVTDNCTISLDYSKATIEQKVYPKLREFKAKYGIDIPIGLVGVDMPRLDRILDSRVKL